jgi:glyceraldehyde-3-phosphate dehydrogenase/erythrose-4-phosphate dehydrogenase
VSGDILNLALSVATNQYNRTTASCKISTLSKSIIIHTMRNVGINGFGRIGRLVFRAIVEQGLLGKDLAVVALNDLVPADNLAYPVKYDSTQGRFQAEVSSAKSRPDLPDESTGLFTDAKMAKGHLVAGAKKVIISAPAKHLGVSRNDKK